MESVVELSDVRVAYGSFEALRGISIAIPPGATALVGRNGAGKSTLMRLLLGLIRSTSGSGRVLDIPLSANGTTLRKAVGFMPESDSFLPGLAGHDHVAFAGELCGLSQRQAHRRAHEVLAYVDLGEARYRRVEQYSTGMKQRLKLAVALVHDPKLLLLDEPTVGLDPPGRHRMLELIHNLANQHGKSMLLSTHLLADVEQTCGHVVMVENGAAIASGSLDEVLQGRPDCYRLEVDRTDAADLLESITAVGGRELEGNGKPAARNAGCELHVAMPAGFDARQFFEIAHRRNARLLAIEPQQEDLARLYHRLIAKPRERIDA